MSTEIRPRTNNYLKSSAPIQGDPARFEFFCSGAPAHVTRAAQWARREANAGRVVSIYRRIEGLEDLLEVGEWDPADLREPN